MHTTKINVSGRPLFPFKGKKDATEEVNGHTVSWFFVFQSVSSYILLVSIFVISLSFCQFIFVGFLSSFCQFYLSIVFLGVVHYCQYFVVSYLSDLL